MYDLILAIVKCIETNVILHYTRTQIIIIIISHVQDWHRYQVSLSIYTQVC